MDEYIDRQELIDAGRSIKLKDICPDWNVPIVAKALEQQGQAFLELIKKAPSEDVKKVKHGEWIPCGDGEHTPLMCSSCFNTWSFYKQRGSNYCPNCGAKMDLKEGVEE